jgi:hypothetical protein
MSTRTRRTVTGIESLDERVVPATLAGTPFIDPILTNPALFIDPARFNPFLNNTVTTPATGNPFAVSSSLNPAVNGSIGPFVTTLPGTTLSGLFSNATAINPGLRGGVNPTNLSSSIFSPVASSVTPFTNAFGSVFGPVSQSVSPFNSAFGSSIFTPVNQSVSPFTNAFGSSIFSPVSQSVSPSNHIFNSGVGSSFSPVLNSVSPFTTSPLLPTGSFNTGTSIGSPFGTFGTSFNTTNGTLFSPTTSSGFGMFL